MSYYDSLKYKNWEKAGLKWYIASRENLARAATVQCLRDLYSARPNTMEGDPLARKICEIFGQPAKSLDNLNFRLELFLRDQPFHSTDYQPPSPAFTREVMDELLAHRDVSDKIDKVLSLKHRPHGKLTEALSELESAAHPILYQAWSKTALSGTFSELIFRYDLGDKAKQIPITDATLAEVQGTADSLIEQVRTTQIFQMSIFEVEAHPGTPDLGSSCLYAHLRSPWDFLDLDSHKRKKKPRTAKARMPIWARPAALPA